MATGLAWTPVGGEVLFVEATAMPGAGKLMITGQLGEVMRESAQAALSWVRGNVGRLAPDLPEDWFATHDIHVHVPAGAVPKDGPSAGVAMAVALASLVSGKPVTADVAMTGEVTLTGQVLPVGGLKEKSLAAQRAGIKRIIVPERNEGDIARDPRARAQGGSSSSTWTGSRRRSKPRYSDSHFGVYAREDERSGRGSWRMAKSTSGGRSRRVRRPIRRARILMCGA